MNVVFLVNIEKLVIITTCSALTQYIYVYIHTYHYHVYYLIIIFMALQKTFIIFTTTILYISIGAGQLKFLFHQVGRWLII